MDVKDDFEYEAILVGTGRCTLGQPGKSLDRGLTMAQRLLKQNLLSDILAPETPKPHGKDCVTWRPKTVSGAARALARFRLSSSC